MDNGNFEQNDKKIESVYSTRIRAGKRRTYFFDVRATRGNDYFLTITESRKRFDNNGYDRHKIFLYKEDFNKFLKAITEAVDHVKTELMPDFDFDAFNHEDSYDADGNYIPPVTQESVSNNDTNHVETAIQVDTAIQIAEPALGAEPEQDIDPATITEKKPLEARDTHASQGDNLSGEEVDKW
jgi:hypothetical protein